MGQIGSCEIETASGTVSVPVFSIGDSGVDVSEAIRVQTSTGPGFIPAVQVPNPTGPDPDSDVLRAGNQPLAANSEPRIFTTQFEDGFESGDFSAWDGTSVDTDTVAEIVSGSSVISGTYSAHLSATSDSTASSQNAAFQKSGINTSAANTNVLFQCRPDQNTTSAEGFTAIYVTVADGDGTGGPNLKFDTDGRIYIWDVAATDYVQIAEWSANQSYKVRFVIDYGNGTMDTYIDGIRQGSDTPLDSNFANVAELDFNAQTQGSNHTIEAWIDDARVLRPK